MPNMGTPNIFMLCPALLCLIPRSKSPRTILLLFKEYHRASAPSHLTRLKFIKDDQCECGTGIEDQEHLIFQCPTTKTGKKEMIQKMEENLKFAPQTLKEIFKGNQHVYQLQVTYPTHKCDEILNPRMCWTKESAREVGKIMSNS